MKMLYPVQDFFYARPSQIILQTDPVTWVGALVLLEFFVFPEKAGFSIPALIPDFCEHSAPDAQIVQVCCWWISAPPWFWFQCVPGGQFLLRACSGSGGPVCHRESWWSHWGHPETWPSPRTGVVRSQAHHCSPAACDPKLWLSKFRTGPVWGGSECKESEIIIGLSRGGG